MKNRTAQYWVDKLSLEPHVEGGAYREVYRTALTLPQNVLTEHHKGPRNAMTNIYFLLEYWQFSAFHRIASDELWHHYDGGTLTIYEITPDGLLHTHLLGMEGAALPFAAISAGSWFASRVETPETFALCGCTVAPGFDFADFELADRNTLMSAFPAHEDTIRQLTR